ncbi:hypothetical protein SMACR_05197 [Sordaria macrospora]|uniref:WGS project CABT00000000 data, contig 2.8 n=2 Tax=Sordaria macrospora TaxID=5147 RepID=F7VV39_SORMK|nr:uncharacterized protein SMAC_05197 [Sordaria macrospora k-hell]KAA8632409.1 hypothetical protein SMACR_05197 [Sordaria macrospora]KAH7628778.1 hypothetical protein B0T09DRAFT_358912 [Sordaria sp. MPI-SDFR-AT-0083]WPJ57315.1 hypothetical protein SMAC4_05197 [Sordaria macrospora]CCC09386.1 unnamed protein product [Sordaria macrospora k-hell]
MKFTALLLATGITTIAAMPWSSKAKKPSSVFEDITLRIEVVPKNQQHQSLLFSAAGAAAPKKSGKQDLASFLEDGDDEKPDICWLLCAGQELKCPEGWHSKQLGDCWTCCKTIGEDSFDL